MAKNSDDRGGKDKPVERATSGRQKLMEAALELAATTRSLASLGLREVARHAGLNPNTFYRHFKDFDDLGVAMLDELGTELRAGLRIGGDAARVVVGGAGDRPGPLRPGRRIPPLPALTAARNPSVTHL